MSDDDNISGSWREWSRHVLAGMKRSDKSLQKLDEKMDLHNDTLLRLTVTVEEHVKRTNTLESRVGHVEEEVDGLNKHINSFKWVSAFKPINVLKVSVGLITIAAGVAGLLHLFGLI